MVLDLKKAFDLVDHDMLLHKLDLHHFSTSALHLVKSFIYVLWSLSACKNWRCAFRLAEIKLWFTPRIYFRSNIFIYINDMSSFFQNSSIVDLYADDSTIHESGHDVKLIESNLQSSIDILTLWCTINKILRTQNPLKTKCMLIGSNHRHKHSQRLTLNLDNYLIDNVSSQIVMGTSIDNNFTMELTNK